MKKYIKALQQRCENYDYYQSGKCKPVEMITPKSLILIWKKKKNVNNKKKNKF